MAARRPPTMLAGPRGLLLAALLAAVIGAVAGYLAGGGKSHRSPSAAAANVAAGGPLRLSFPASWQRAASAPAIPGLTFSQPIVLTPAGGAASALTLIAGEVNATGAALLPRSLLTRQASTQPTGAPVTVGPYQALLYGDLSITGLPPGALSLYVIPTTAGVATIACLQGTLGAAPLPATSCPQIADSLRLAGARSFPVAPSASYTTAFGRVVAALARARSGPEGALTSATTPAGQAAALGALAAAYASAAAGVGAIAASPAVQDVDSVTRRALAFTSSGYANAASAVRRSDAAAYRSATIEVNQGSATVQYVLEQLTNAGYAVG